MFVRDSVCVLALLISDLAGTLGAVGLGCALQAWLRKWIPLKPLELYTWLEGVIVLFIVIALATSVRGLYLRRDTFWNKIRRTIDLLIIALVLALAVLYMTQVLESIPRSLVILSGISLLIIVPVLRLMMIWLLYRLGLWGRRIAVEASEEELDPLADDLERDFALGYRVVTRNTLSPDGPLPPVPARVDEVVVSGAGLDPQIVAERVSSVHRSVRYVTVSPELSGIPYGSGMTRFMFDARRILLTSRNRLKEPGNLVVKRMFDLVVAGLGLVLVLPLLLLVAILIRLGSRGPAIFAQKRIGRRGKRFRCFKFRTMFRDAEERLTRVLEDPERRAEWDRYHKLKDDPRVTGFGRFMRATSLDELPQLLNVFWGTMSLVGPRPLPEYHYEKMEEPFRSDYLDVKPGITGLWQVSGRSDEDLSGMTTLNSWYARNWSLWLDLTIILRTVPAVLSRRGAY
jgi:undecaprenyl-phosphate galactose phosphotransferase